MVAPNGLASVRELAKAAAITWIEREYRTEDLDGVFLAIAATENPAVNNAVFVEAQQRGTLCNAVDDPPNCDFYFGAVVRRGALQIAISSAGESPALVQGLRKEIDAGLDPAIGGRLRVVGELRREILATYPASENRTQSLHRLAQVEVCDAELCPARRAAHVQAAGSLGDTQLAPLAVKVPA